MFSQFVDFSAFEPFIVRVSGESTLSAPPDLIDDQDKKTMKRSEQAGEHRFSLWASMASLRLRGSVC